MSNIIDFKIAKEKLFYKDLKKCGMPVPSEEEWLKERLMSEVEQWKNMEKVLKEMNNELERFNIIYEK